MYARRLSRLSPCSDAALCSSFACLSLCAQFNPLAFWSFEDCWTYLRKHNVPYHPLHDVGFSSLGDMQSTRKVQGLPYYPCLFCHSLSLKRVVVFGQDIKTVDEKLFLPNRSKLNGLRERTMVCRIMRISDLFAFHRCPSRSGSATVASVPGDSKG